MNQLSESTEWIDWVNQLSEIYWMNLLSESTEWIYLVNLLSESTE